MVKKLLKDHSKDNIEAGNVTLLAELLQSHGFRANDEHESADKPSSKAAPATATGGIRLENMGKLVLRFERKGHGGKTVTLLSGLIAAPAQIEALARILRKALGVGATVEKGVIILQGDVTARTADWLNKHGARQVVIGN